MAENEDTAPRRKTLDELMQFAQERAARGREAAEQKAAETPRQLFLPGFDIGAFPNHLNRSSFIAPIARGRRKFHRQAEMVTAYVPQEPDFGLERDVFETIADGLGGAALEQEGARVGAHEHGAHEHRARPQSRTSVKPPRTD